MYTYINYCSTHCITLQKSKFVLKPSVQYNVIDVTRIKTMKGIRNWNILVFWTSFWSDNADSVHLTLISIQCDLILREIKAMKGIRNWNILVFWTSFWSDNADNAVQIIWPSFQYNVTGCYNNQSNNRNQKLKYTSLSNLILIR